MQLIALAFKEVFSEAIAFDFKDGIKEDTKDIRDDGTSLVD